MELTPGFVPIGMKEYGGILYIASVNKEGEGEIGSIPSPIITWSQEDKTFIHVDEIALVGADGPSNDYVRISNKLRSGNKFLVSLNLKSDQSSSRSNESRYEFPLRPIERGNNKQSVPLITQVNKVPKGLYRIELYSIGDSGTLRLTELEDQAQKYYDFASDVEQISPYWFVPDGSTIDMQKMLMYEECLSRYPKTNSGYLAIKASLENIDNFSMIPRDEEQTQFVPVNVLTVDNNGDGKYVSQLTGFKVESNSGRRVKKISIKIFNEKKHTYQWIYYGDNKSAPQLDIIFQEPNDNFDTSNWGNTIPTTVGKRTYIDFPQTFGFTYYHTINGQVPLNLNYYASDGILNLKYTANGNTIAYKPNESNQMNSICRIENAEQNVWYTILAEYYDQFGNSLGTYRNIFNPYVNDVLGSCYNNVVIFEQVQQTDSNETEIDIQTDYRSGTIDFVDSDGNLDDVTIQSGGINLQSERVGGSGICFSSHVVNYNGLKSPLTLTKEIKETELILNYNGISKDSYLGDIIKIDGEYAIPKVQYYYPKFSIGCPGSKDQYNKEKPECYFKIEFADSKDQEIKCTPNIIWNGLDHVDENNLLWWRQTTWNAGVDTAVKYNNGSKWCNLNGVQSVYSLSNPKKGGIWEQVGGNGIMFISGGMEMFNESQEEIYKAIELNDSLTVHFNGKRGYVKPKIKYKIHGYSSDGETTLPTAGHRYAFAMENEYAKENGTKEWFSPSIEFCIPRQELSKKILAYYNPYKITRQVSFNAVTYDENGNYVQHKAGLNFKQLWKTSPSKKELAENARTFLQPHNLICNTDSDIPKNLLEVNEYNTYVYTIGKQSFNALKYKSFSEQTIALTADRWYVLLAYFENNTNIKVNSKLLSEPKFAKSGIPMFITFEDDTYITISAEGNKKIINVGLFQVKASVKKSEDIIIPFVENYYEDIKQGTCKYKTNYLYPNNPYEINCYFNYSDIEDVRLKYRAAYTWDNRKAKEVYGYVTTIEGEIIQNLSGSYSGDTVIIDSSNYHNLNLSLK